MLVAETAHVEDLGAVVLPGRVGLRRAVRVQPHREGDSRGGREHVAVQVRGNRAAVGELRAPAQQLLVAFGANALRITTPVHQRTSPTWSGQMAQILFRLSRVLDVVPIEHFQLHRAGLGRRVLAGDQVQEVLRVHSQLWLGAGQHAEEAAEALHRLGVLPDHEQRKVVLVPPELGDGVQDELLHADIRRVKEAEHLREAVLHHGLLQRLAPDVVGGRFQRICAGVQKHEVVLVVNSLVGVHDLHERDEGARKVRSLDLLVQRQAHVYGQGLRDVVNGALLEVRPRAHDLDHVDDDAVLRELRPASGHQVAHERRGDELGPLRAFRKEGVDAIEHEVVAEDVVVLFLSAQICHDARGVAGRLVVGGGGKLHQVADAFFAEVLLRNHGADYGSDRLPALGLLNLLVRIFRKSHVCVIDEQFNPPVDVAGIGAEAAVHDAARDFQWLVDGGPAGVARELRLSVRSVDRRLALFVRVQQEVVVGLLGLRLA
mmetsp:Transcript_14844/g.56169  ORF Transcript_14844/g.56169 Transcript_14844/m.56169 type:complete len:488 (+) Transcript_14844:23375-24838(+)|eukprot:scaffold1220_cov259-Pinguiococcus_pyrenoidosus.AAC.26